MNKINKIFVEGKEIEPKLSPKKGIVLLRRVDNHIYISGHGPENQITGEPLFSGRIGKDLTIEEGYAAARECAIIILGAIKDTIGSLDRIKKVVRVFGLVNCDNGFSEIDSVMDGFSDTFVEVLEERGYHCRTVMGTHNLPNDNIPVEIEAIFEVE